MATKLDPIQIQRASFDEDANAVRVSLAPTQMAVQLDHNDGDSVYSHKKMQIIDYKAGQLLDTSLAEVICCTEDAMLIAVILGKELQLPNLTKLNPLTICVPCVKLDKDCVIILRG